MDLISVFRIDLLLSLISDNRPVVLNLKQLDFQFKLTYSKIVYYDEMCVECEMSIDYGEILLLVMTYGINSVFST